MIYRLMSAVVVCVGCLTLLNGIAIPVMADPNCTPSDNFPDTVCDPAHAIQRHLAQMINVDCFGDSTSCVAGQNSQCGTLEGYKIAGKGLCVVTLNQCEAGDCKEDVFSTFIALDYYTSDCGVKDGICTCIFYHNNSFPTQYSEVCDCQ